MKFKNIPAKEKEKIINKMINYVKSRVKSEDATDDDLYYACRTMGATELFDFVCKYLEEE